MLRKWILVLLLILVHLHNSSCVVDSFYETDKIEFNTGSTFEELFISANESNEEIKKLLDDIDKRINQLGQSMSFGTSRESFMSLASYITLFQDLDIVEIFVQSIDSYYEKFHRIMTGDTAYSDEIFRDFVQKVILDVKSAIEILRKTLTDTQGLLVGRKNLVSLIGDYAISQRAEMCNGPQMMSNILVQLFQTMMLAEMKSSLILSFAYIYRYIGETDTWKMMNSLSRMQFEQQFGIYVSQFAANLIKSDSSYLRACDPEKGNLSQGIYPFYEFSKSKKEKLRRVASSWRSSTNELYYELKGTIQATIFRYLWALCLPYNCNAVWRREVNHCFPEYHNHQSICPHPLVQCAFLGAVKACQLKSGPNKFQYVNSSLEGLLGKDSECPKDNGIIIEDGSGNTSSYKVCACNCYLNRNKISLAIIESDVKRNMVITGIRFYRKDQILYIQPREGKLGTDSRIIRHSERWVSIPQNIEASNIHAVDRMNRVFFLDDLRLPFGFVLTGVKFSKLKRRNISGFGIEIFGLPFDYQSGKINDDGEFRISKKVQDDNPQEPLLIKAVSSVYTNLTQIVSPENMTYVSLVRSTLKDDFGQSTLPLFDAIPIRSNPPFPLGGIGIFHKGVEGYAGYISLRTYGINYAYYFLHFKSNRLKDGKVKFDLI